MAVETAPLIPAATILLVREGRAGLEVLMVERRHQIDFASGALVFPGGKLNGEDSAPGWDEHADGAGAPDQPFAIAAIREAFEESGVLLARTSDARGPGAALAGADAACALEGQRSAIASGQAGFLPAVAQAGLALALDALSPYAHWITPQGMPKRFDTRFFIAAAPEGQLAVCDGGEAVDAVWVRPGEALAQAADGRRKIIFPTRLNLERLAGFDGVDKAIAAARARAPFTVEPQIERRPEGLFLTIPEAAGYGVTVEPLEGNMP